MHTNTYAGHADFLLLLILFIIFIALYFGGKCFVRREEEEEEEEEEEKADNFKVTILWTFKSRLYCPYCTVYG